MSLPEPRRVNPKIWQICAGPDAKIPKIHSKVYYFPQGHLEHACRSPNSVTISQFLYDRYRPSFPCIISAVNLFLDTLTDEVFAKLLLTPITGQDPPPPTVVPGKEDDDGNNLVSYVKTLRITDTKSVLNIPHECAELIFPKLDLEKFQSLTYVKNSRLRTGWSHFRKEKKLVAKDSVVFLKNAAGKILVGIRRNTNFPAAEVGERGRNLTESAVLNAVELADKNMEFEVVYYPTARNWCDFVMDAKVVDDSMKIGWESGMRVKLTLKKDESSNSKTYYQPKGTIYTVFNYSSNVPNWRILEVHMLSYFN
jgi:hypothetical protein